MPEFNVDRIRQIIGEVNSSLHKLSKYSSLTEEEFLASEDKVDSAKYNLIVAIAPTIIARIFSVEQEFQVKRASDRKAQCPR